MRISNNGIWKMHQSSMYFLGEIGYEFIYLFEISDTNQFHNLECSQNFRLSVVSRPLFRGIAWENTIRVEAAKRVG